VPWGLGLGFFALYLGWGLAFHLRSPRLFYYLDQAFDADVPSRIMDLTRPQGPHLRAQFHPLFVLLLNPIGFALRAGLRGLGVEASGRVAAIALSAAAGGAGVAVFSVLLRGLGLAALRVVLWSLIFGLSASELAFGSLPESWIFSGLSLLVLFACGTRPRPPRDGLIAAGIAAFGMAVTNLAAAALVRARWLVSEGRPGRFVGGLGRYLLIVLLATALLSALQSAVYPGGSPFYRADPLAREDRQSFVQTFEPAVIAGRAGDVLAHLLFFNLTAPRLLVTETGTPRTSVDFPDPSLAALRPEGAVHAVLWTALLFLAGRGLVRLREPLPLALFLWLALQAALHLVFGTSLFLYSCQWTFAVVALAAVGTERIGPARALEASLLALAALQALANAAFLLEVLRVFAEPR
jgi:hypothetical protein